MLKLFTLRLYALAIAICCTSVLVISCSDDDENVPVMEVTLGDTELLLIEGQSQLLKVIIVPENATNKNTTWESSNEDVITVSELGEVKAKAPGTAIITVTAADGGKTAICEVRVERPVTSVTGVSLNKTELPILVGEKETLIATVTPEGATVKTVKWTSDDHAVATVSETGEVEAISIGTATITATTLDGEKTATCVVTVDASSFKVKFEMNGGDAINDVIVNKGNKLVVPTTPTKAGGPEEGLYEGIIDPDLGSFVFEGWFTDKELTIAYDFEEPVVNDLTLYAKWSGDVPQPIDISDADGTDNFTRAYNYLNVSVAEATNPITYTFVLASDVTFSKLSNFKNANVTLNIIGKEKERVIKSTLAGNMFVIDQGELVFDKNITLTATNLGNYHVLDVNTKGRATMKTGSKISGSVGSYCVVRVQSSDAKFTLDGGEISGNEIIRSTGGVAAMIHLNWGPVDMKGGVISNNKVSTKFGNFDITGGVLISRSYTHFKKTGGEIKDNVAAINAEDGETAGKAGQQVFYSPSKRKIDANVGADISFESTNTDVAPWVKAE